MKPTKKKILNSALKLFNENGFVNVRLQHIADDAIMSVGNLAYHFANKELIVTALYDMLTTVQRELLIQFRTVPLFENIDLLLEETFKVQEQYIFFYKDTLELIRAYPDIGKNHQQHISYQINQLLTIIDFNVSRGALRPESIEGVYDQLTRQVWMTMDLWTVRQAVIGEKSASVQEYKMAIWCLLIPHFTETGKQEYLQMLKDPYGLFF